LQASQRPAHSGRRCCSWGGHCRASAVLLAALPAAAREPAAAPGRGATARRRCAARCWRRAVAAQHAHGVAAAQTCCAARHAAAASASKNARARTCAFAQRGAREAASLYSVPGSAGDAPFIEDYVHAAGGAPLPLVNKAPLLDVAPLLLLAPHRLTRRCCLRTSRTKRCCCYVASRCPFWPRGASRRCTPWACSLTACRIREWTPSRR